MPTNVPPEYRKAEESFRAAKALDEKIERLEDMMSLLPKHKGTEHLFADLKRRMSQLRRQMEIAGKKTGGGFSPDIQHEGAAQIVLVGPPNSGKSAILKELTHAEPEIGDYPFTTQTLQPGMMPYLDIQLQMIDTPPVTSEYMPSHLLGLVRSADAVLLVADLDSETVLDDLEMVFSAFGHRHVRFVANTAQRDRDSIPARVIANKTDTPEAEQRLVLLREMMDSRLEVFPISCVRHSVTSLPNMLFHWLGIQRVYTKIPGKKADMDHPFTVFSGQTVDDVCLLVHKDFHENLKFARRWRGCDHPVTVSRGETVQDGDILELHI